MENEASAGAVAAGNQDTAAAAAALLKDGGNAFDAALAGMVAACVTEPVFCSFGGGGFLLAQPEGAAPQVVDFFTQTPGRRDGTDLDFQEISADFGTATQVFHIGRASSAVPGLAAGLFHIHRRYGRAPMTDILAPGIAMARDGVALDPLHAHVIHVVRPIVTATEPARALFSGGDAPLIAAGDRHRVPELADFLDALDREGPALFYEGAVAEAIADLNRDGGLIRRADLARYRAEDRTPIEIEYRGCRIALNGPPSAGGSLIAYSLALLDGLSPMPPRGDPAFGRRIATVQALTGTARRDSGFADAPDPDTAARLHAPDRIASDILALKTGGTTHISVADRDGNVAALSLSNGEGNGHIVPGTGIMMNNMLGEEDLNPGGFFRWRPNTRVQSMMTPCLADLPDGSRAALGSGGSNRIRSAILQTLIGLIDCRESLADAVAAPRLHLENAHLSLEHGFDDDVLDALRRDYPTMDIWPDRDFFFGGVHGVRLSADGISAAGDPRRGGTAVLV